MKKNPRKLLKKIIVSIIIVIAVIIFLLWVLDYSGKIDISKYLLKVKNNQSQTETLENFSISGCLKYMDYYVYFDQDGIVRSTSLETEKNIPLVTGLEVDYIVLNEELPIKEKKIFVWLLEVVQTTQKYNLELEKLFISEEFEMTLYIKNVRVEIGKDNQTVEKIKELSNFYDQLKDLSGTLYMQDFDLSNKSFTFKSDAAENTESETKTNENETNSIENETKEE